MDDTNFRMITNFKKSAFSMEISGCIAKLQIAITAFLIQVSAISSAKPLSMPSLGLSVHSPILLRKSSLVTST